VKVFLTGATGFIGGSLAQRLVGNGHEVHGLVRSRDRARLLQESGISPVLGSLDDDLIIAESARQADAVLNAASSDHRRSIETLIEVLAGTEKPLIHTSGSSIVCDDARGEYEGARIYDDDSFLDPLPIRQDRVAIDRLVRTAGISLGVRAVVICPSMTYGTGRGLQKESDQIPKLVKRSKERGAGVYIGQGLNRWSNVHIDDLVDLYLLALEKAPGGSFFFAESAEATLKQIAEWISNSLRFGGKTESWKANEAIAEYGDWARFALGSNSRVRATNARRLLHWCPTGPSLQESIQNGGRP
jgi:nucleoside-diphosphate-sugar epimerase